MRVPKYSDTESVSKSWRHDDGFLDIAHVLHWPVFTRDVSSMHSPEVVGPEYVAPDVIDHNQQGPVSI